MAKKRDVVVATILIVSFLIAFGFFAVIFIGLLRQGGDYEVTDGFGGDRVGIVEMFGVIDEFSGREAIRQLDAFAENSSVKSIVLHVNSPGGGVSISQEVHDAVLRARDSKPVVAAMASVAASGGYYISCAADRILANAGSLTGSIGVIFQFHTFGDLFDKVGVGTETITSGELKAAGTYARDMTEEERLMLRSVVLDSYEQFVEAVAEGRDMDKEEIYPLADGSVFTGLQAYNLGLIDTLGGLKEAVDLAAELAGIEGEPATVRPRRREQGGFFDLLGGFAQKMDRAVENRQFGPQLLYLYQ